MINKFIDNFFYLLNSLIEISIFLIKQESLYDEDFMSKFKSDADKAKLDKAVEELKRYKAKQKTILLDNGENVTIRIK